MSTVMGYRSWVTVVLTAMALLGVPLASANPLDDYVAAPDANYSWELTATYDHEGYTEYILSMTSQRWLTDAQVDRPIWHHHIVVTVPDQVDHETGMLFIAGGGFYSSVPTGNEPFLVQLATQTHTVIAQLRQIPNEPLTFTGYREETEDGLIAYGWKQFLLNGDPMWLMRLPMTKAAVRGMDSVTAFMATPEGGGKTVNKFVVSGGSKRGWTTWTTAAVDSVTQHRVVAIAPLVIDCLNLNKSMRHHFDAYGFWSPAVGNYTENGIFDWMGTPQMDALNAIEEPYSYRDRLTMPKYVVSASQDQFFLPDSSQFYFDRLKGEKRMLYIPNVSHGGEGPVYGFKEEFIQGLMSWYSAILNNVARPEVTWYKRHDGSLVIDTHGNTPTEATLWKGTNPSHRCFIKALFGEMYQSSTLEPVSPGHYVAAVDTPATGWTAFYALFKFDSGDVANPFVFSTEISVVPDVLPYGPQYSLGEATPLLDDAFYTQGGPTPILQAGLANPSNSGRCVAFWGANFSTNTTALFMVKAGEPSNWQRLTGDVSIAGYVPIVWTPDDTALIVGSTRLSLPPAGQLSVMDSLPLHGISASVLAATSKAVDNYAMAKVNNDLILLPIMPNGDDDLSRQPVVVTDLAAAGVQMEHVAISGDGSTLAFDNAGDVYTLRNLAAIVAAPKRAGTNISSQAPTALDDENVFRIRTTESDNFASFPALSYDGSMVYFSEDWNNAYSTADPFNVLATDFDLMVSYSDGTEADTRLTVPGTQVFAAFTRAGTRAVYSQPVDGMLRLFMASVRVTTASFSGNIPNYGAPGADSLKPFDSDGTATVNLPIGVSANYPSGTQAISIETPVLPESPARFPSGVTALPFVRVMGPDDATFNGNATLVFKYNDAQMTGLNEDALYVYRLNTGTNVYEPVISFNSSRDPQTNTIEIEVDRLGTYAIGASSSLDSDGDGMPDDWETAHGLNPNLDDRGQDADSDGLLNLEEYQHGTNPLAADTDGDGLTDKDEVRDLDDATPGVQNPFNPLDGDSTGNGGSVGPDGVLDGENDWDGDGQSNAFELENLSNPLDPASTFDADGDGMVWSTFLGGTNINDPYQEEELVSDVHVDANGNVYVAGYTVSSDFPTTAGAFKPEFQGSGQGFVSKLDSDGQTLLYSTFIGGGMVDVVMSIAVRSDGGVVVFGATMSPDFPLVSPSIGGYRGGVDDFVARLTPDGGSLVFSTCLGGTSDELIVSGSTVALDADENIYVAVTTRSWDFPVTPGAYGTAFHGDRDVCVAKIMAAGDRLVYSTYLGGGYREQASSIKVSAACEASVVGYTASIDFPVTESVPIGGRDGFVARFDATGSTLLHSTLVGGTDYDEITAQAFDADGNLWLCGKTISVDFPVTAGALQEVLGGTQDAFLAQMRIYGTYEAGYVSSITSTLLGGSADDIATDLAVDSSGVWMSGQSASADFPTTPNGYDTTFNGGDFDVFAVHVNSSLSAMDYGTYLGGSGGDDGAFIALDPNGNPVVAGSTRSADYPTTPGAFDTSFGGTRDGFLTKLHVSSVDTDGDGLPDGAEVNQYGTNPLVADTDGDGLSDGEEVRDLDDATPGVQNPLNPLDGDSTGNGGSIGPDGVLDGENDWDGDGQSNAFEIENLSNPLDAASTFDADGDGMVWSTFLGGNSTNDPLQVGEEIAGDVHVDAQGYVYVAGFTVANDFPTTSGAFKEQYQGTVQGFVSKLDRDGCRLMYSTFLGGSMVDAVESIAVRTDGGVVAFGVTYSTDFPLVSPSLSGYKGELDNFVARLAPDGRSLIFSTYLGGIDSEQFVGGDTVALDADENIYVAVTTQSWDFPVTPGAFGTAFHGDRDVCVAKITAGGELLAYSTYLGGGFREYAYSIQVNGAGEASVAGYTASVDFPVTENGPFGGRDGFVTRLDATGSHLLHSTLIGGAGDDEILAQAFDADGNLWLCGSTKSGDFPVTPGTLGQMLGGAQDAFVAQMRIYGTYEAGYGSLLTSTLLDGSNVDIATDLAVDSTGVWVVGQTGWDAFPTTANGYDTSFNGGDSDVFAVHVNTALTALDYGTYLGGSGADGGALIALDPRGNPVIAGTTESADYPATSGAFDTSFGGTRDGVVTKLDGHRLDPDRDHDGMPDFWEDLHGLDSDLDDSAEDPDGDGLTNLEEFQRGTDPRNADTDGDGLTDGQETMDLDPVTPGVQNPFDPIRADSTGDNGQTAPDGQLDGDNDWDGDGVSNRQEFIDGTDPLDSGSHTAHGTPAYALGTPTRIVSGLPGQFFAHLKWSHDPYEGTSCYRLAYVDQPGQQYFTIPADGSAGPVQVPVSMSWVSRDMPEIPDFAWAYGDASWWRSDLTGQFNLPTIPSLTEQRLADGGTAQTFIDGLGTVYFPDLSPVGPLAERYMAYVRFNANLMQIEDNVIAVPVGEDGTLSSAAPRLALTNFPQTGSRMPMAMRWSRDAEHIAFQRDTDSGLPGQSLYVLRGALPILRGQMAPPATVADARVRLLDSGPIGYASFTPDAETVFYTKDMTQTFDGVLEESAPFGMAEFDIAYAPSEGGAVYRIALPGDQVFANVSPDGTKIAYADNSSGTWDIYVADVLIINDADHDGLTDDDEGTLGTDPNNPDTDGDGLSDAEETRDLDPATPDVQNPFNPLESDSTGNNGGVGPDGTADGANDWDSDGVSNADEFAAGTDPLTAPNRAPSLGPIGDRTVDEGSTIAVSIYASDPDGDVVSLSAANLPSWASFTDNGDGTGTLTLSPGYDAAGTYSGLAITATDNDASPLTGTEAFSVTVTDVPQTGAVSVDVTPDTASWTISGPAGFEGNGQTYVGDGAFTSAPIGSYTWTPETLSGYTSPAPEIQILASGATVAFTKSWTVTPTATTIGNTTVFGQSVKPANRPAMPFVVAESGMLESVSMYHDAGTGNMMLAVYGTGTNGLPGARLGVTAITPVSATAGWQTIPLTSPVSVTAGQTIWLAWLYQEPVSVYYQTGTPGRAVSTAGWSTGMPNLFGTSTVGSTIYSIYATYAPPVPQTVQFSQAGSGGSEAATPANMLVTLSAAWTETVTVDYAVTGGTATGGGVDYTLASGQLSFAPGETSKPIAMAIADDTEIESNETVVVTLSAPVNATLGSTVAHTYTIQDNDGITPPATTIGNTTVFSQSVKPSNRPAMPFVVAESGMLESVSMYHDVGTGNMMLAVYGTGTNALPGARLGVTAITPVSATAGWQTIPLTSPVSVTAGQTIWLAWLYQEPVSVYYQTGTPGRAVSTAGWSTGMPNLFGTSTVGSTIYSIYATYAPPVPPTVQFSQTSSSGSEATTPANVQVTLSAAWTETVTVDYAVTGGTATGGGVDYTLANGQLTFAAGETSKPIAITVVNDSIPDPNETIEITLTSPDIATLGTPVVHTFTIQDDDTPPTVQFSQASSGGSEASTPANMQVTLSAASAQTVTVDYAVTGGTATGGGVDYTLASGQLSFAPGETSKPIAMAIVDDTEIESNETVVVTLSTPVNATLGSPVAHTYTIQDNDGITPPSTTIGNTTVFSQTVKPANRPAMPFVVAEDGVLESVSMYHASGTGNMMLAVYGTGTNGLPDVRLGVTASTPVSAVTGWQTIPLTAPVSVSAGETIWLAWLYQEPVSVYYQTGTPGRAVSTAGWSTGMPTLFGTSTVGSTIYSIYATYAPPVPPTVQFSQATSAGAEAATPANVQVTLSAAWTETVTVDYAVTGGTATGGGVDYTLANGQLTFAPGEISKPIAMVIVDDTEIESGETIVVTLSSPVIATLGTPASHTFTIQDDDTPPTVQFSQATSGGSEASTPANMQVTLSAASAQTVTVDYAVTGGTATGGGADYTLASGQLSFAPGETSKPIAMAIADDTEIESNETVVVTLSAPVNATLGSTVAHTYTIQDNDNITPPAMTIGNTTVFGQSVKPSNRPAMPFVVAESGMLESISMYHDSGTGNMMLAVYGTGANALPGVRLGVTAITPVSATAGWQTIPLTSPVSVTAGQTIWLAWLYQEPVSVYYQTGTPGRAVSTAGWSTGMPTLFGTSTVGSTIYSICATYAPPVPPTVQFSQATSAGAEAATPANVQVTLSTAWTETVTVDYAVTGGTATGGGVDYTLANGQLTFAAGEISKPIEIDVVDDIDVEPGETIVVTLSLPVNATLGSAASHTFTILDDDTGTPPPTIGNTTVFGLTVKPANRPAMPFVVAEDGMLESVSMYHASGTGNMMLAVYGTGTNGLPDVRLGVTASTPVSAVTGWQTIPLTAPVSVSAGETIWLAWVYQNQVSVYYQAGTPGRAVSTAGWSSGMPGSFGTSTVGSTIYSIYATYAADVPGPSNDRFSNRMGIFSTPAQVTGTNVDATSELGEPAFVNYGGSVWWYWTAPQTGSVTIDTIGSDFDTALGIYTGDLLGALTTVWEGAYSAPAVFDVIEGETYIVAVESYNGGQQGNITLNLSAVTPH